MSNVFINQIEVSVPDFECQRAYEDFLPHIYDEKQAKRIARIIESCDIDSRYSVLENIASGDTENNAAFYQPGRFPQIGKRMDAYREHALPLAMSAVERLNLNESKRQSVTHLIVHSCTGYYAPGLDIEIIQRLGLSPTVNRTFVGHMGCYAAFPAMKLAKDIIVANAEAVVLVVGVELCTLHLSSPENASVDQMISSMIFSDGASAMILSIEPVGLKVHDFFSTIIPDSMDLMGWQIKDESFSMILDQKIPALIGEAFEDASLKARFTENIDMWCVHPGGKSILDKIEDALSLSKESLDHSRSVLRRFGNMSSVTVLFVLREFLMGNESGTGVAMGFGPGLVLESMSFSI